MNIPSDLQYTKTHEWVKFLDDGRARIGLTDYAQNSLGDIVFIGLPETGGAVDTEKSFADVESVKSVSEVFSPVNGIICAVNGELESSPENINAHPYDSWLIEVAEIGGRKELLSSAEYEAFIAGEE